MTPERIEQIAEETDIAGWLGGQVGKDDLHRFAQAILNERDEERDSLIQQQDMRIEELEKAAQRMVEAYAPHADKCRPCAVEWQNLKEVLKGRS